jgi:hypothetical protein
VAIAVRELKTQLLVCQDGLRSSEECVPRVMSTSERNAVRYIAGYVIKKLVERYPKQHTQKSMECLAALNNMASKLKCKFIIK